MTAFFVTGTDTGVGKTEVARALLLAGQGMGRSVAGYKPVETGCDLAPADAQRLSLGAEVRNTYAFDEAVGPAVAAARSGHPIDLSVLRDRTRALCDKFEFVIVEGAGGFLVPLTQDKYIADLAVALELPLIVVVADKLGAQNHCLLTCEAIRSRGLQIAAIVLNQGAAAPHSDTENEDLGNREQIAAREGAPVFDFPLCENDLHLVKNGQAILQEITDF